MTDQYSAIPVPSIYFNFSIKLRENNTSSYSNIYYDIRLEEFVTNHVDGQVCIRNDVTDMNKRS